MLKKHGWIAALFVAVAMVFMACPPDPTNEGEQEGTYYDLWSFTEDYLTEEKIEDAILEGLVNETTGLIIWATREDFFEPELAAASNADVQTFTIVDNDGTPALEIYTGASAWGVGIDLQQSYFEFRAGDRITVNGKFISGTASQIYLSTTPGTEGNIKYVSPAPAADGEFVLDITLTAANVSQINGSSPAAIRIGARAAATKLQINEILIERLEGDIAPVADDFEIHGLMQFLADLEAVTITPKTGKSQGAITIYYEGETDLPTEIGEFEVTFDVAAATGYLAVTGLVAGTLHVLDVPEPPVAADFVISNLVHFTNYALPLTVTAVPEGPTGAISNIRINGGATVPTTAGTYDVTIDIAALGFYAAATNLNVGSIRVIDGSYTVPTGYTVQDELTLDLASKTDTSVWASIANDVFGTRFLKGNVSVERSNAIRAIANGGQLRVYWVYFGDSATGSPNNQGIGNLSGVGFNATTNAFGGVATSGTTSGLVATTGSLDLNTWLANVGVVKIEFLKPDNPPVEDYIVDLSSLTVKNATAWTAAYQGFVIPLTFAGGFDVTAYSSITVTGNFSNSAGDAIAQGWTLGQIKFLEDASGSQDDSNANVLQSQGNLGQQTNPMNRTMTTTPGGLLVQNSAATVAFIEITGIKFHN